jgi:hypothetical protein
MSRDAVKGKAKGQGQAKDQGKAKDQDQDQGKVRARQQPVPTTARFVRALLHRPKARTCLCFQRTA